MKKLNLLKKTTILTAAFAVAAGILLSTTKVNAAIPYNSGGTIVSPVPAFNVYSGVPQIGDEADFLKARVTANPTTDASTPYVDPLATSCVDGQNIQMRVYVHNGASDQANGTGNGASVAHGTKVKVTLPNGEATSFTTSAQISATNVATVTDTVIINCNGKKVKLSYVTGSAQAYQVHTNAFVPVNDTIVTTGAAIRSQDVDGDVWGCFNDRVLVLLTVKVEEVPPVIPVYSCDLLTVNKLADNKYRFSVTYTAKDGAVFQNVTYKFGDGSADTTGATAEHTYTASTEIKNVVATVNFMVNGEAKSHTSPNCKKSVTLVKDNCTVPGKENLPKNDAACKVDEKCLVKGKETLAKNDVNCKEVVIPATLPNTGAGNTIAMFLGASFVGAFLYRMRLLKSVQ